MKKAPVRASGIIMAIQKPPGVSLPPKLHLLFHIDKGDY
jgi:hypothetical protein